MAHLRRHTQIEDWDGPPLLYIRPELDGISAFDFSRSQYLLEEGYRATRRALAGWKGPAPPGSDTPGPGPRQSLSSSSLFRGTRGIRSSRGIYSSFVCAPH